MRQLLVIDDEPSICWGLQRLGESLGLEVVACATAEEGLEIATNDRPDVVVLDVRLPGMSGLEALEPLREILGDVPILLITAFGDLATAVSAVRKEVFEYLVKPFDLNPMKRALLRALSYCDEREAATKRVPNKPTLEKMAMVGTSLAMQQVFQKIALAAASETTTLLAGESGTGKELAAQAIHANSDRADGPFVAVNIASLSPSLVESELFGHVGGAFTGADGKREGLLVQAQNGTLFLDEIADIPLSVQVMLLRVLEQNEVLPVGGSETLRTDFRLVSASHKRLLTLVKEGKF